MPGHTRVGHLGREPRRELRLCVCECAEIRGGGGSSDVDGVPPLHAGAEAAVPGGLDRERRLRQGDDNLDERAVGLCGRGGAGVCGERKDGREECEDEELGTSQARIVRAFSEVGRDPRWLDWASARMWRNW